MKLRQIERILGQIRATGVRVPEGGWIATILEALGMSAAQLGRRMGLSRHEVHGLEKREANGTVTLNALRRAAEALDADLVHIIVPRRPLKDMLERQALAKAQQELDLVGHSMRLEDQGVEAARSAQLVEDRAAELLVRRPRDFWDLDTGRGG